MRCITSANVLRETLVESSPHGTGKEGLGPVEVRCQVDMLP